MVLDDQEILKNDTDSQSISSVGWLFHYAGIAFLLAAFVAYLLFRHATLDVQLQDKYFVISYFTIFAILSIYFYTTGSLYAYVNNNLRLVTSRPVGLLHFVLSTISVFLIGIAVVFVGPAGLSNRYRMTEAAQQLGNISAFDKIIFAALILFVISQLLLFHLLYYRNPPRSV